jgi:hypothetical protein
MVALDRPGAGEELLARYGFVEIERIDVPFVAEFADSRTFARAMALTGPGYKTIQNVGEVAFAEAATNEAIAHIRDGLPLRPRSPWSATWHERPGSAETGRSRGLQPSIRLGLEALRRAHGAAAVICGPVGWESGGFPSAHGPARLLPRSLAGVLEPGEASDGVDRGHAEAGGRDRVAAVADDREQ